MATTYKTSNGSNKVTAYLNATESIVVSGNDSVSNIVSFTGEEVTGAIISKAVYGVGPATTGYWTIARDGATVAVFSGSGITDFSAAGLSLDSGNTAANIDATLTGSAGYLILELKK